MTETIERAAPPAPQEAREQPGAPRRRVLTSTWLLALVIAILTWPVQGFTEIHGGDDGSWIIGLHMAVHQGLHFGSQVDWSYGPLGFLTLPQLLYPGLAALSLAYVAAVQFGLALSVLWAARRWLPLPVAALVSLVASLVVPVTHGDDRMSAAVLVIVFIACIAVLRDRDERPATCTLAWAFPVGAGAVSGLEALIRLNAGLTVVLLCGLTVAVGLPRRRLRSLAVFAASLVVSVVVLWLGSGQALGDLPTYVVRSSQLVSGFSQALMKEGAAWEYLAAALAVVVVAAVAWAATRGWSRTARVAAGALTLLLVVSAFKQGFVRHDESHTPFFFACAMAGVVAFGCRGRAALAGVGALAGLAVVLVVVAGTPSAQLVPPARSPLQAAVELRALAVAPRATVDAARQRLQGEERVDPATLALLRGRRVHVWPKEAAVAWAYPQIDWSPLPVMQTRMTYTRALDRADAAALASPSGPERVLRSPGANPFDSPASATTLFCRFAQVRATPAWQVLTRVPDRCGSGRLIQRLRTTTRRHIEVPTAGPDEMVVARLHGLTPDLAGRVETFLYKGTKWSAMLGKDGQKLDLAPDTASGPTILRVPPQWDYPGRFRRSLGDEKLFVLAEPSTPGEQRQHGLPRRSLTVDFYAVPLRAPAVLAAR